MCCVEIATALRPSPYPNPLLEFINGSMVQDAAAWPERRAEVADLLQSTLLGYFPPQRPNLTRSEVLNVTHTNSATLTAVRVTFDVRAGGVMTEVSFDLEIYQPGGEGPFPLFLTQWNHRQWALLGLNRGYISVIYPGADTRDAAPAFQKGERWLAFDLCLLLGVHSKGLTIILTASSQ